MKHARDRERTERHSGSNSKTIVALLLLCMFATESNGIESGDKTGLFVL